MKEISTKENSGILQYQQKNILIKLLRYLGKLYSKQDKDKLRDNFKYLVYYILLQIVYINDYCRIY